MTQDEIIEMAVQAGIAKEIAEVNIDIMEAFAKLVAQHERERLTDAAMKAAEKAVDVAIALEREACAKICDEFCYGSTKILVEKAIQARGQA